MHNARTLFLRAGIGARILFVLCALSCGSTAFAAEGDVSPERNAAADPAPATNPTTEPSVVRVPYIPETLRDQIRDEIKRDVLEQARRERWGKPGAYPEWISRIKFDGDIRLRYQQDLFQEDNFPFVPNFMEINRVAGDLTKLASPYFNTTTDRRRWRVRTRLGLTANVADDVNAGIRLTTGNTSDPVSTNQTLGNSNNRNAIVLDRAYLRFDPYSWLTVAGGKIPNPWFGTDLVWDDDLNFDGVAMTLKQPFAERWTAFMAMGAFPLQEIELSSDDKSLYGAQLGLGWGTPAGSSVKLGVAYYAYDNILGRANDPGQHAYDYTAPQYLQKGNSLFNIAQDGTQLLYALASEYEELAVTASADRALTTALHLTFTVDYVKNLAFDRQASIDRGAILASAYPYGDEGYLARLAVGMPDIKQRGDWQVSGTYKRLESDAVLDAFTDSDFHLGGTNAKGWILGAAYGLNKNTWLNIRYLSADEIEGPPLGIDVWQLDINARF